MGVDPSGLQGVVDPNKEWETITDVEKKHADTLHAIRTGGKVASDASNEYLDNWNEIGISIKIGSKRSASGAEISQSEQFWSAGFLFLGAVHTLDMFGNGASQVHHVATV